MVTLEQAVLVAVLAGVVGVLLAATITVMACM